MIASDPETKTCGKCLRRLPVESFRFANKPAGKRHTICNDCKRQYDQDRRLVNRQKVLCRGLRHIRRAKTVETVANVLQDLCTRLGSFNTLFDTYVEMLLDEKTTPPFRRLAGAQTLLHMAVVHDRALLQQWESDQKQRANRERTLPTWEEAEADLRALHSRGHLLQGLRGGCSPTVR